MILKHVPRKLWASKAACLLCVMLCGGTVVAQKYIADSLARKLLANPKDTNRVQLLWQLAEAAGIYNPDTALVLSQQALFLSRQIKYTEGESKSLGALANAFVKIGNYPRAIALYLDKLKLEEKRNEPRNLASVLLNLGVVNVLDEDYGKALSYYAQADSVITRYDITNMKYFIRLNLGDVYYRLGRTDTAFTHFSESLVVAQEEDNADLIGTSMTGLAHCYLRMNNYQLSRENYQEAIGFLSAANDDEILCEASLGLANLYRETGKPDSAAFYGDMSLNIAKSAGFLSHQLNAAKFLTNHYREHKNNDSAFGYLSQVLFINDSINSKVRIREAQILTTNERLRQLELVENRKVAANERFNQLQHLLIGMFIPGLFIFTFTLSRVKINVRVIKLLGVLSLLIFFEYLNLLTHPYVGDLIHHTPVYHLLISVAIAAVLIPLHHRVEHWVISRLTRNQVLQHSRMARPNPRPGKGSASL